MSETPKPHPALDAAIEACADCIRLYNAAAELVDDLSWRRFLRQMVLRRETLLHRLRFAGVQPVEQQDIDDLVTLRGKFGELILSVKGLFGDEIQAAMQTLEPAEARLVERLGEIGVAAADPGELAEMFEAVSEEHQALRTLLAGMENETIIPIAEPRLE